MQLRALSLRNIRSYRSLDLAFGPGTTLVSGDVGAGKTSLLYAVEMALFGFAEVDPAYLVRHDSTTALVGLTLEDAEHRFGLRREFKRKSRKGRDSFELTESSFSVDGSRTNYPATELRQRVIELLGFPDNPNPRAHSDFWRWAVYIPQERMREVLAQNPDERLATIRKALGVEQYQTAAENAWDVAHELKERVERREAEAARLGFFQDELTQATAELERHRTSAAELEQRRQGRSNERATLETSRGELQAGRLRLEARRGLLEGQVAQLEHLQGLIRDRTGRVTQLEDRKERLDLELRLRRLAPAQIAAVERSLTDDEEALAANARRLAELEASVEKASATETQVTRLRAALEDDSARLLAERNGLDELQDRLRDLESSGPRSQPVAPTLRSVAELDGEIRDLELRRGEQTRSVAATQQEESELESLLRDGTCPRCHQPVHPADFAAHREELGDLVRHRQAELTELEVRRQTLLDQRASRERYERVLVRWQEVDAHRETVRRAIERARSELEKHESRRRKEEEQLRELEREWARAPAAPGDVGRIRKTFDEITHETRACRDELRSLAMLVDRDHNLADEAARIDSQASEERLQLEIVLGEQSRVRATAESLEAELAKSSDVERELADVEQRIRGTDTELRDLTATRASELALAEAAGRRIETAARGVADRRKCLEEARRLARVAEWLTGPFRESALRLERRVLGRAQTDFDRALRRSFATLVEDPGLVARSDSAFGPAVEVNGTWTPPEALSGGERTALALAFRLALGQVVRGLGQLRLETLVLDEPTDGFSPEQVVRLGELLEDLRIPQVVIVSHESGLAGIADRVIRVEKVHGESRIDEAIAPPGLSATEVPEPELMAEPPRPRRRRSTPKESSPDLTARTP